MAPIKKSFRQKLTYESAYPLKKTINVHRRRNNFWEWTFNLLKNMILENKTILKMCGFTAFAMYCLEGEKTYKKDGLESIQKQLEGKLLKEKQQCQQKKDVNSFISTPKKDSAQDFAGLLWSWKVNDAANKTGKRIEFLQKCLWLTIETMTDIDLHILVQLLQKYKSLFPNLKKQIINYKHTARYLQEEIFSKENVVPKVIKALNHWFTIMPLLEEIRQYTGWLYLLNIKAFLLDADTLYDILMKVENKQQNARVS